MVDSRRWMGLVVALALGCGGAPAATSAGGLPALADRNEGAAPATRPSAVASTSVALPPAPPPAPPVSPAAKAPPPEVVPFPPPAFAPLQARTATAGDGVWVPLVEGWPMARSAAHPHPIKGFVHVALVAIDLSRAEVHLVAGKDEPESKAVPPERRPAVIPASEQDRLLAVFNGGFMARHGRWGARIGGETFVPPRDEGCTVALFADRTIKIAPWPELAPGAESIVAFRQTPPCMVHGGALHPDLVTETKTKRWGAADGGDVETRRSAVGVDAAGGVLFYGLGEWITAKGLADAMKAAGAVSVGELDINWGYTRFLLFGRPAPDQPLQVTSTLIPKIEHSRFGYVDRPSGKDFFYVLRRSPP